jgi:hypothetical protein
VDIAVVGKPVAQQREREAQRLHVRHGAQQGRVGNLSDG